MMGVVRLYLYRDYLVLMNTSHFFKLEAGHAQHMKVASRVYLAMYLKIEPHLSHGIKWTPGSITVSFFTAE